MSHISKREYDVTAFTIVEVLISISIFTIIVVLAFYSLNQSLSFSLQNRNKVTSNITAQGVAEFIKSAWQNPEDYNKNCVSNLSLPNGTTATSQPLQVSIYPSSLSPLANSTVDNLVACQPSSSYSSVIPIMRRVTIESINAGRSTKLIVDILKPGS